MRCAEKKSHRTKLAKNPEVPNKREWNVQCVWMTQTNAWSHADICSAANAPINGSNGGRVRVPCAERPW